MGRSGTVLGLLLACALFVTARADEITYCTDSSSVINGVNQDGVCFCDVSHYFDEAGPTGNCDAVYECVTPGELDNLSVKSSVTAVSTSIVEGSVQFEATVAYAPQRHLDALYFNDPSCGYPNNGVRTPASCQDSLTISADMLDIGGSCLFTVEHFNGVTYWDGNVVAVVSERLGSLGGSAITRTVVSTLSLEISAPSVVNVTGSPVTVLAEADVQAAVLLASNSIDDANVQVQLATSVQAPYRLDLVSVNPPSSLTGIIDPVDVTTSSITDCSGSPCFQIVEADIPLVNTCYVDGDWSFVFAVSCLVGECTGSDATVVANLQLGNLCPHVYVSNDITGALSVFSDDDFTDSTDTTESGVPVHVELTVDSELNIASVSVKEVRLIYNNTWNNIVLVSDDTTVSDLVSDYVYDDESQEVTFVLTITRSSDPLSDADFILNDAATFSATLFASLQITYDGEFASERRRAAPGTQIDIERIITVRSASPRMASSASVVGAVATTVAVSAAATAAALL